MNRSLYGLNLVDVNGTQAFDLAQRVEQLPAHPKGVFDRTV